MIFINNPNQFGGTNVVDSGALSSAGLSATNLDLTEVDLIEVSAEGEGAAALTLKQVFALSLESDGSSEALTNLYRTTLLLTQLISGLGTASLNLSVANGINLARTEGAALATLYLGQDITDITFATDGVGGAATFLRLNDEPNQFIEPDTAGSSNAQLNLLTEQLVFFRSNGQAQATYSFLLDLVNPEPIINELSENAFYAEMLRARLFVNDVLTNFKSFTFRKQKGGLSSSLSVVLARPELSQIPPDAVYSFQIGKKIGGVWSDFPLLTDAELDTSTYALASLGDTLEFSAIDPNADRLLRSPNKNTIYYDGLKIDFEVEADPIFDADNNLIETESQNVPVLTLKKLLNFAFVEGCGFEAVETNLPDYEISQCTFSINGTFLDAVRSFIGRFRPLFFTIGNTLWILNRTQTLPEEFSPRELSTDRILSYRATIKPRQLIDGYEIQYYGSRNYGTTSTELVQWTQPHGKFGEPNFTETEIAQIYKHWKDGNNRKLRTELLREVRTTYKGAIVIQELTEDYIFDGQGKQTEIRQIKRAYLPTLPTGAKSLQTVKQMVKEFTYKTDPFDPKRVIPARITTFLSGLYAIDSTNQQLGADYKRDYERVAESGNLYSDMTTSTGHLQTIIETFVPVGNGQVRIITSGTDHLQDAPIKQTSEIVSGDVTLSGLAAKPLKMVVYRPGINAENKTLPIQPFPVAELPIFFGLPLAQSELEFNLSDKQEASIEVAGFDEALDYGTYFSVGARGRCLGNFLTEAFTINGNSEKITTTIEAGEV